MCILTRGIECESLTGKREPALTGLVRLMPTAN
jgi:hypothetical protein